MLLVSLVIVKGTSRLVSPGTPFYDPKLSSEGAARN